MIIIRINQARASPNSPQNLEHHLILLFPPTRTGQNCSRTARAPNTLSNAKQHRTTPNHTKHQKTTKNNQIDEAYTSKNTIRQILYANIDKNSFPQHKKKENKKP
jgi:hypothetical protein